MSGNPWADTPTGGCLATPGQTHPWADTPWADTPPLGRNTPQADTPPGQTPPWADTPLGRHPQTDTPLGRHPLVDNPQPDTPARHPPPHCMLEYTHPLPSACWDIHAPAQCMLGYGQQTGGTHPTGMHSCLTKLVSAVVQLSPGLGAIIRFYR